MSKERDIGSKDFWSVDDLTPPMGKTTKQTALPKPMATLPLLFRIKRMVGILSHLPFTSKRMGLFLLEAKQKTRLSLILKTAMRNSG